MDHIESALVFATNAHLAQKRKGSGIPYVTHCVEVMKKVSDYGIRDESPLCAALLHDVYEDAPEYTDSVKKEFGPYVDLLVEECTRAEGDDATLAEKYSFLNSFYRKTTHSLIIKIADRFCNVMDYRNSNKDRYAAWYAMQAYPLYGAYIMRVRSGGIVDIDNKTQNRILFDVMRLKELIIKTYPNFEGMSREGVDEIVLQRCK